MIDLGNPEPYATIKRTGRWTWEVEAFNADPNLTLWRLPVAYWNCWTERGAERTARRWIRRQMRKMAIRTTARIIREKGASSE